MWLMWSWSARFRCWPSCSVAAPISFMTRASLREPWKKVIDLRKPSRGFLLDADDFLPPRTPFKRKKRGSERQRRCNRAARPAAAATATHSLRWTSVLETHNVSDVELAQLARAAAAGLVALNNYNYCYTFLLFLFIIIVIIIIITVFRLAHQLHIEAGDGGAARSAWFCWFEE